MRAFSYLFALLIVVALARADSSFVAPTSVGTAAVGQIPGTTTNDDAAAGKIGEYASMIVTAGTATVTITNASPTVITWTGHPYPINSSGIVSTGAINFTTSGGLPTGLTVGTNYYAVPTDANTLHVATSVANALAGTFVNTSSSGSGTQTGVAELISASAASLDLGGFALTAGDWDCRGSIGIDPAGTTTVSSIQTWLHTVSASNPGVAARVAYSAITATLATGGVSELSFGPGRFTAPATTNFFATSSIVFGISTLKTFGLSACRRVR